MNSFSILFFNGRTILQLYYTLNIETDEVETEDELDGAGQIVRLDPVSNGHKTLASSVKPKVCLFWGTVILLTAQSSVMKDL